MAERSFEIVARARDEASAAFSKINKKILSDQRRLSDMQAAATLEGKDKELHGVEKRLRSMADRYRDNAQMMAQITRTGMLQRQSIEEKYAREAIEREKKIAEAAIQARGKVNIVQQGINKFTASLMGVTAGAFALQTVSKGLAAIMTHGAAANRQMKMMAEDGIAGWIEGQIEVNRAYADLGRALPLVGSALGKIIEVGQNNQGLLDTAKALREMRQEVEGFVKAAADMEKQAAGLALKAGGLSPAQQAASMADMSIADREKALEDMSRRGLALMDELHLAKTNLEWTEKQAATNNWGFGIGIGKTEVDVARLELKDRQEAYDELAGAYDRAKAAADEANAAERKIAEQGMAKESGDAEEKRLAETTQRMKDRRAAEDRNVADAERQRDEEKRAGERRAADEAALNDTVLKSGETARETELRHSKDHYFELWKLYKDDAEMQAAIIKASVADIGMINAKHDKKPDDKKPDAPTPGGPMSRDLGQMQSHRFLRNAPGALDPLWAKTQIDLQQKMLTALENLEKKEPVTVIEEGVG